MHAVDHMPAAVVRPTTLFEVFIIVPAPKKPIPDKTCADSLAGSKLLIV